MEISTVLKLHHFKANFAYLDKENNQFTILKSPYPSLPTNGLKIGLKDVKYKIMEGVLYISGTQIYYYKIANIFIDFYSYEKPKPYYKICHERNDKLVTPFVETDILIKRWLLPNKWVKGVDLRDPETLKWHLLKQENPFEFATSNFKLIEYG